MSDSFSIRLAQTEDIPALEVLIPLSVRALQAPFYSPAQMDSALGPVFGVDRQLIADGTYFVVEDPLSQALPHRHQIQHLRQICSC